MYKETQKQCVLNITLAEIVKTENFKLKSLQQGKRRKDRKPTRHMIVNMLSATTWTNLSNLCCTNLEEINESRRRRGERKAEAKRNQQDEDL